MARNDNKVREVAYEIQMDIIAHFVISRLRTGNGHTYANRNSIRLTDPHKHTQIHADSDSNIYRDTNLYTYAVGMRRTTHTRRWHRSARRWKSDF